MSRSITKEEWLEWKDHPITELFFRTVQELREDSLQLLANGTFAEEPGKQNVMIGKINALTKVLETTFGEDGIHE